MNRKPSSPRNGGPFSTISVSVSVLAGITLASAAFVLPAFFRLETKVPDPVPIEKPNPFRIGIVTDIHGQTGKQYSSKFMDPDKIMRPLYRFEGYMQDVFRPDLIVEDGDFVEGSNRAGDKSVTDFTFLRDELDRTGFPVLHVIGNHDRRGFDDSEWKTLTGNDSTYYFRDESDIRIVVLDYDDSKVGDELPDEDASKTTGSSGKYSISENQFAWIDRTLADAGGRRVVVFTHVPVNENAIMPGAYVNPSEDRRRLRDLFAEYGVKAVISGHVELFRYEEDRGVRYFVLPGFHRSEAKSKPEKWFGTYSALTITDRADMLVRYEKEFGGAYEEVWVPSEAFDTLPK
ncbi:MAG: hypothetical protein HGA31_00875 [Candidatus Moranbacteria bacterium]|nr:hypothetical protein [Candidatus Moranbacteria bacterium]